MSALFARATATGGRQTRPSRAQPHARAKRQTDGRLKIGLLEGCDFPPTRQARLGSARFYSAAAPATTNPAKPFCCCRCLCLCFWWRFGAAARTKRRLRRAQIELEELAILFRRHRDSRRPRPRASCLLSLRISPPPLDAGDGSASSRRSRRSRGAPLRAPTRRPRRLDVRRSPSRRAPTTTRPSVRLSARAAFCCVRSRRRAQLHTQRAAR